MTGSKLPATSDGVEMAMESYAGDPSPDNPSRTILEDQSRLIRAQISQLTRQRWRDVIVTLLGLILLGGIIAFVVSASRADGVVVEAISVPPDFAQRGLTGTVVAGQLLDKLAEMQAKTETLRAERSYANSWSDNVEIEVPYANVSIGEARRLLRQWLGKQTRLSGEVTELPDGRIALTSRLDNGVPARAEGKPEEFDALLAKNAEAIYAETQPYRYAVWLTRNGRKDEAVPIMRRLTVVEDENDRLWGYNGLAIASTTDLAEKARLYKAALAIRPDFTPALNNLVLAESTAGNAEAAFQLGRQLDGLHAQMRRDMRAEAADFVHLQNQSSVRRAQGDNLGAALADRALLGTRFESVNARLTPVNLHSDLAYARDVPAARQSLAETGLRAPGALAALLEELGPEQGPGPVEAEVLEDWPRMARLYAPILTDAATRNRVVTQFDPTTTLRSALAIAQARSGQAAAALATIAPTPLDNDTAVIARATVLSLAGRAAEADALFAKLAARTPSLPGANESWAEMLVLRGEGARAAEQARLAIRKGPKWPDPQRTLGDALLLTGDTKGALAAYAKGVKMAPNWGALRLRYGDALLKSRDRAGALREWRAGIALPLSPADRAALRQRLGIKPPPATPAAVAPAETEAKTGKPG